MRCRCTGIPLTSYAGETWAEVNERDRTNHTLEDNQHLLLFIYHERNRREDLDIQTFNGIYDYVDFCLAAHIFFLLLIRCKNYAIAFPTHTHTRTVFLFSLALHLSVACVCALFMLLHWPYFCADPPCRDMVRTVYEKNFTNAFSSIKCKRFRTEKKKRVMCLSSLWSKWLMDIRSSPTPNLWTVYG